MALVNPPVPTQNTPNNVATNTAGGISDGSGIGSLINSLGQIGSGIVGSTAGTQVAQNFQAQGQNAINAQNAYLGQAVGNANSSISNTGTQLGTSQGYTGNAVNALQGLYGQAQALGGQSVSNQNNLLSQATSYLQPGINEAQTGGQGLNQIFNNPGGANNYSGFNNNPGYNFAVQQGNNQINRQAAASGNLYSTNTLANLSQYNTGMASQNYNNYVGQLMSMAGLGNTAASTAGGQAVTTGTSQAQTYANQMQNALGTGQAQAGAYNQASVNPLTAAGLQNQAYLQQGQNAITTGQSVGDIYQNIGQYNASGTAQNLGSLQQSLNSGGSLANGITGAYNGISSLLGNGLTGAQNSSLNGYVNNTASGIGNFQTGGTGTIDTPDVNSLLGNTSSSLTSGNMLNAGTNSSYYPTFGDAGSGYDASGGGSDLSNLLGDFPSAGGQAATSGAGQLASSGGSVLGAGSDVLGLADAAQNPTSPGGIIGGANAGLGLYNQVNQLSGGSGIAGTGLGSASSALGAAGAGLGLYSALQNPKNPVSDISGALDADKLYNSASSLVSGSSNAASAAGSFASDVDASSSALDDLASGSEVAGQGLGDAVSSIAAYAGPVAAIGAIGYGIATTLIDSNSRGAPLTFNSAPGVQVNPYGKLPSGNSIAFNGSVGFGAGNNEAQGSGQLYFLNPSGSAANNTKYQALGQAATNSVINAYSNYQKSQAPAMAANPFNSTVTANVPSTDLTNANAGFTYAYNSTGGQAKWGVSQAQWQQQVISLMNAGNANGGSGFNVGIG